MNLMAVVSKQQIAQLLSLLFARKMEESKTIADGTIKIFAGSHKAINFVQIMLILIKSFLVPI